MSAPALALRPPAPAAVDPGKAMHALIADLYPLCRSITGEGLRETLRRLQALIPLALREVPTGTPVLDWTVPNEWNIRDGYVLDARGERVIDFHRSNLHVLNYSVPVHRTVSLAELRAHCFTLPEHPDWTPYRTSYYREAWGFCLPHRRLAALPDGDYVVHIDATLAPGHLTYGELVLPGELRDEILISTHACHPSLCNDNLSGIAVAAYLARALGEARRNYTYRFLFVPGTIGSIAWLAANEAVVPRIKHGLVLAGLGDAGSLHYKRSRRGNAGVDRAAAHVLAHARPQGAVMDFTPYGYDERQYCSPGFDLPVGCLSRSPWGTYPEYHTSADDLAFVRPESLADSLAAARAIVDVLEHDATLVNQSPKGEPQLGRRGLYGGGAIGGSTDPRSDEMALLWVLNLSDGSHSLLDIAERSGLPFAAVRRAATLLVQRRLLGR